MICPCGGKRRVLDVDSNVDLVERIRCCLRCGKLTVTEERTVRVLPGGTKNKQAMREKSTA